MAEDQGPVGLLRPAPGEGAGEAGRGGGRLAGQEDAGGVAVQAMHQAGTGEPLPPGGQEPVDVIAGLGSTLDGEACGLVEGQDIVVLVQDQAAGIGSVPGRQGRSGRIGGGCIREGRHADLVSGFEAGLWPHPGTADPDLARACQLLDLDLRQMRPTPTEPAVQPDTALPRIHGQGADLPHARTLRMTRRPRKTALVASTTERPA